MYCEPCRVERLGTARFCVLCGTRLIPRPREEIEADLARVRWLLAELPQWDATNVGARPRTYLIERYRQREKVLLSAILHLDPARAEAPHPAEPSADEGPPRSSREQSRDGWVAAGPSLDEARDERVPPPPPAASDWDRSAQVPAPAPGPSLDGARDERVPPPRPGTRAREARVENAPGVLLELQPDAPTVEDRIVAEASSWSRIWKPFFTESIGWFAGAFLILSGTFFLVSDSWSGMSSTTRALVVFGLASGWTLGFSAWAQFLWRRETTRGSARVLKLIGAAMAPLAPFAVGPVVGSSPLIAIPLVVGWCVIAAALALGVTRDLQKVGLRNVPLAMAACAALMGLAPLITRFHGTALWLMVIPIGLLWANSRSGAGAHGTHARLFAYLAPLYLAAIFGARLHYALLADQLTWGTWAPFFALALTAALELRAPVGPDGRPHWERAADPISVGVVGGQLGLMAWALLGAAPAFFLTSLIGAHTCWRLLKGSSSPLAPRWIYALYFFSYFAFQTCGQLVPGFLTELLKDLKARLGYAPQGTLPFAYNAVYAAVFVIAGAVLAVYWLGKQKRSWADPLLRCTWITSALTVALAISSLGTDTRPAMISVPLLLALCLGLGLWLDRPAFTRVGAGIAIALAATLAVWAGPQSAALMVALVALGLAVLSVPYVADHRLPLSLAGYSLVALAVGLAWVLPGNVGQVAALALAFAAAWLIGRNLDLAIAQEAAWLIPAVGVARAMVLWAPEYAALGLAIAAVALGLLARDTGRLRFAEPASALAAVVAAAWQLFAQDTPGAPILLGMVLLLAAAALAGGARRTGPAPTAGWRDVLAICFGTAALLPQVRELQMWPSWSTTSAAIAYAVLGLAASIWAAVFGRRWRPALLASLTIACAAVVCGVAEDRHLAPEWAALISAVGVLVTLRALLPSISVPIAALFALRATDGEPAAVFALAFGLTALALFEEWDFTWANVLGKRRVAWAGSLSSFVVVGLLALASLWTGKFREANLHEYWIASAVLPLLWVRATRSGVLALALAPLIFVAAAFPSLASFNRPVAPWVVAGVLVALTHLLE
ncbi:MAG: hypothetical protein H6Q89_1908, partial [Myxococcaceae bacterium]|nr:hypothetical protein [Myxococcaceae bacterium]